MTARKRACLLLVPVLLIQLLLLWGKYKFYFADPFDLSSLRLPMKFAWPLFFILSGACTMLLREIGGNSRPFAIFSLVLGLILLLAGLLFTFLLPYGIQSTSRLIAPIQYFVFSEAGVFLLPSSLIFSQLGQVFTKTAPENTVDRIAHSETQPDGQ
ncbi:MAG: hypothetical protein GXX99_01200 [Clostridiales bacterium]|nr:hypothetical protein [Clostridiales bacterium]